MAKVFPVTRPSVYSPKLPIRGGGGHVSRVDTSESPGRNPIVEALMGMADRQQNTKARMVQRARQKIRDLIGMDKLDPSVLQSPEFESARKEVGYPAMTTSREPTLEDFLSKNISGYDKPTVRVGPQGRVKGATYGPKTEYPEGYQADLKNAISAINRGGDKYKVYQRIAGAYPKQSAELKRILLYTPASSRLAALREALFGGE